MSLYAIIKHQTPDDLRRFLDQHPTLPLDNTLDIPADEVDALHAQLNLGNDSNSDDDSSSDGSELDSDELSVTPLMLAAILGKTAMIRMLIARGANINALSPNSALPALACAIQANQLPSVVCLVEHGAPVNDAFPNKATPLFWAANEGRLAIAHYLISKGANVNAGINFTGQDALTPADLAPLLFFPVDAAVQQAKLGMVQLLIQHGARIEKRSLRNAIENVLGSNAHTKVSGLISTLETAGYEIPDNWLIDIAFVNNAPALIDYLSTARNIDVGAPLPSATFGTPRTILSVALVNDRTATVRRLLEHGAVNTPQRLYAALQCAIRQNKNAYLRELLNHNAPTLHQALAVDAEMAAGANDSGRTVIERARNFALELRKFKALRIIKQNRRCAVGPEVCAHSALHVG